MDFAHRLECLILVVVVVVVSLDIVVVHGSAPNKKEPGLRLCSVSTAVNFGHFVVDLSTQLGGLKKDLCYLPFRNLAFLFHG
jgi:hypothetical protein